MNWLCPVLQPPSDNSLNAEDLSKVEVSAQAVSDASATTTPMSHFMQELYPPISQGAL
jgi:hypothetical protein